MLFFHLTVVTLFIIFLLLKTFLLITNKKAILQKIQAQSGAIEIILAILIIATGVYLFITVGNSELYLLAKITLVIFAIPMGIVSMKRENKILAILSLSILIYIYGISGTNTLFMKNTGLSLEGHNVENLTSDQAEIILNATQSASLQQGKVIYKVLCVECHGEDGQKIKDSAANLSSSNLNFDEKVKVITEGKGVMKGYDPELSEQEIELVTAYTETLQE